MRAKPSWKKYLRAEEELIFKGLILLMYVLDLILSDALHLRFFQNEVPLKEWLCKVLRISSDSSIPIRHMK